MFHQSLFTPESTKEEQSQTEKKPVLETLETPVKKNDTKPGVFQQLYKAEFTGNNEEVIKNIMSKL